MELFSLPAVYDTAFQFRNSCKAVDFIESCIRMYTERPVRSVLDIACGTGHYMREFARRGYTVYGVDIDRASCRYARRQAAAQALSMHVLCRDMTDFFLPQPCDLAVCFFDSLTYLPNPQSVVTHFQSAARALCPGGLYFVELGVIDSFDNHNVKEVWTEKRRDFSVTSTYLRGGDIFEQRFQEHCSFRATYKAHCAFFTLSYTKLALTLREFERLLLRAGGFTPLVYYEEFNPTAFLDDDELPWRVIAILQRQ